MRTYSRRPWWTERISKKSYGARSALEWDMSLRTATQSSALQIVETIREKSYGLSYVLVGGMEADQTSEFGKESHVHIALIFLEPQTRNQIIGLFGLDPKEPGLYLTPRNEKYLYATWKIHHTKKQTKISNTPSDWVLLELGKLPVDSDQDLLKNRSFLIRFVTRYETDPSILNVNALLQRADVLQWAKELEEFKDLIEDDS